MTFYLREVLCVHVPGWAFSDTALHRNVHTYCYFIASCGGRYVGIKLRARFTVQTDVQASSLYYALFQWKSDLWCPSFQPVWQEA